MGLDDVEISPVWGNHTRWSGIGEAKLLASDVKVKVPMDMMRG